LDSEISNTTIYVGLAMLHGLVYFRFNL